MTMPTTRREVLTGLVVAFALSGTARAQAGGGGEQQGGGEPPKIAPDLPGDLSKFPDLDAWIRIAPDGHVTVFTGKAELGTGVKTALAQLAADELDVPLGQVTMVTADTARTPNEGVTAGSHTLQDSGTAIANAAANVRHLLGEAAARQWNVPVEGLSTRAGTVIDGAGRSIGYGVLAATLSLHVPAKAGLPRKRVDQRHLIGRPVHRLDILAKLTGGVAYVQDLRLPGMLHARVVRGPSAGTWLSPDVNALRRRSGVMQVVQDGRFLAIVGQQEWPLVQALRWTGEAPWVPVGMPPPQGDRVAALKALPQRSQSIASRHNWPGAVPAHRLTARYSRPYLMHGSIGPSCAVALWQDGGLTVWTHSQGVEPLRKALAELVALPKERVRCIHSEGAGCYGHNGADDVAADAALVARALPGRPIRMQWSREQEHGWEPLGPAMVAELDGAVDAAGRIVAWHHEVWSNTHTTRPSAAGDLLAGTEVARPFRPTPPKPIPQPEGGGDRNAIPLYVLPNLEVVSHFIPLMPVRVSALRSLGAHCNIFAVESFMDELAAAAGRDPVAFRLAHLDDPRARAVVMRAADRFGWSGYRPSRHRGRGFGFARYKNLGAYCAVAIDVEFVPDTGRLIVHRAVAAVDSGEAVNPDGIRNQIEGGIVQSLSWTAFEEVGLDRDHRTSFDWSRYPVIRFGDIPRRVEVEVIDRPRMPFLGTGEAAQGPTAAALANALAAATGGRRRAMPLV